MDEPVLQIEGDELRDPSAGEDGRGTDEQADSVLSEDDLDWLAQSTAASDVPLYVEDPEVVDQLANLITLSK